MNITIQTNNQNNNHFFMGPWGFVTRVIVMSLAAVLAAAILRHAAAGVTSMSKMNRADYLCRILHDPFQ